MKTFETKLLFYFLSLLYVNYSVFLIQQTSEGNTSQLNLQNLCIKFCSFIVSWLQVVLLI